MSSIQENTERLELLKRTFLVEERQKKRIQEMVLLREKEKKKEELQNLLKQSATSNAMFEQEENQRKILVEAMVKSANPSNGPIVKVLNNVQGIIFFTQYICIMYNKKTLPLTSLC